MSGRRARHLARPLTEGERALARPLFADAIDYDRVAVRRARWWPLQPRHVAMAPDGDLWLPPVLWHDDFAVAPIEAQGLFIHELMHVAQAQRGGRWFLPLARHPFCRYGYALAPGKPFHRYGIEQQAEIVRHAWLLRQGVALVGKPPLARYEAILPFGSARGKG